MPSSAAAELVTSVVERMLREGENDDRSTEAVEIFRHVARWIPRSISPFLNLTAAMLAVLPTTEPIYKIDVDNFTRIMEMHPHLPDLIRAFKEEPDAYENFVAILVHAMGDARAQDTNLIRYEIPKYIPLNYKVESVMPPITGGEKSGRGFSHPVIAKLLCPLRYLDRLQDDPILFKNQVENATIKLRASDERNWPSFLYPEGTTYDESELDKGLFRGHVLLRGLRTIFTGKSSAFTGYRSASKPSQAEMHGMREVFPEAVAYAAVQCYYGLSSLEGWDTEDRFFKLDVFFDKCVQLFTEDPEDEWVIETLEFLSSQMPALTRRAKRRLAESLEDDEGSGDEAVVGILTQRAARRQAVREAEAAEGEPPSDQDNLRSVHQMTPPQNSSTTRLPSRSPARTSFSRASRSPFSRNNRRDRDTSPLEFPESSPERNIPTASTSKIQQIGNQLSWSSKTASGPKKSAVKKRRTKW